MFDDLYTVEMTLKHSVGDVPWLMMINSFNALERNGMTVVLHTLQVKSLEKIYIL